MVASVILLSVFQFRKYRARHPVSTTPVSDLYNRNSEASEANQIYLQRKAELDAVEHQRYEMEAGQKRYETQGAPLFELLADEEVLVGRQELRGAGCSKELDVLR